jgi:hypothetical protein
MDFESIVSESYEVNHVQERVARNGTRRTVGKAPPSRNEGQTGRNEAKGQNDGGSPCSYVSNRAFADHVKEMFERAGL